MTTIAYRAGVMACDSCWTHLNMIATLSSKIKRLSSGALLGQSGENDARAVMQLLDKVRTPKGLPSRNKLKKLDVEFGGLLVFPSGRIFQINTTLASGEDVDVGCWEVEHAFMAAGSGRLVALGAMGMGADPVKAVELACQFDVNSRLPIYKELL